MENEKFYACWERYMEAVNACPHHGFDTWMLVSYFYEDYGMNLMEKDSSKVKPQNNAKGGMYTLNEDVDVQVKMATLSRRLEELEARGANEIKVLLEKCLWSKLMLLDLLNTPTVSPFSNTYNPGWRNHPNLSWKSGQGQFSSNMQTSQPQASPVEQAIVNLSKVMGDFIGDQKTCYFQTHKYAYGARKGKFPSQPQQNPRGVHEIGEKNENSAKVDEVKEIITLRGGKQVDQPMPKPKENKGGNKKKM
ncbi:hypothetical protein CK203_032830 [Vitis vinifera]|uniref:Retrotransposon gag domain-containing protein n=1 Tax=Vitis vinifera TaxID=29760 RepID=A0A438I8E1_VITVI|nr:hypothetical protein CK203_032830 [Vitis vinifera]